MKIIYHHRIASKDGQYVHVSEIINSLTKQGHEINIVAPKLAEDQQFGGEVGIVTKLKKTIPKPLYELLEFCYSIFDFFKLVIAIKQFKPDFIYERYNLFFISGVISSKLFNIPLILEVNAPLFDERNKYGGLGLRRLANWSEKYVWNNADFTLPVTQVLAERILTKGVDKERLRVIHNGINKEHFLSKSEKISIENCNDAQIVIGFVGFCREWHELDKVISLVADDKSQKLFFLIVGDGPIIPELKAQVNRLNCQDRVHFTGLVNREQMPAWLATIDIALQPAVVPYASPLKLIEYMATGKAIVAPAQGNICELLTHEENALLFDEGDSAGFLKAIQTLTEDKTLRKKISMKAKETIFEKSLLWDDNAKKITTIGNELLVAKR